MRKAAKLQYVLSCGFRLLPRKHLSEYLMYLYGSILNKQNGYFFVFISELLHFVRSLSYQCWWLWFWIMQGCMVILDPLAYFLEKLDLILQTRSISQNLLQFVFQELSWCIFSCGSRIMGMQAVVFFWASKFACLELRLSPRICEPDSK